MGRRSHDQPRRVEWRTVGAAGLVLSAVAWGRLFGGRRAEQSSLMQGDCPVNESGVWQGAFGRRHPLNMPGPFYAAETDTCCCGPAEAPRNVLYDEQGEEFVWHQPRDADEVRAVVRAAESDPFSGYGRDGDDRWTPELVRGWWAELPHEADRIDRARQAPEVMGDAAMDAVVAEARREWLQYLRSTELKTDLRRYIFRLEMGRYPALTDELPDL